MIDYRPTSIAEGSHRFVLEQEGKNVLIVIGLNPINQDDLKPSKTMQSILRFVNSFGYDGFVILCLSSERSALSSNLSVIPDYSMHEKNIRTINDMGKKYPESDILLCHGNGFDKRVYFQEFLKEIYNVLNDHRRWLSIGGEKGRTKYGHPRHPLYAKTSSGLMEFDIKKYVEANCWYYNHLQQIGNSTCTKYSWRWALVGNIVKQHYFGEKHDIRYGTKQFSPGSKVFCSKALWGGDGFDRIAVIGRPRHGRRCIEVITERRLVENFRLKKVYNPEILQKMDSARYSWWGNTDEDKDKIKEYLNFLNQ